MCSESVLPGGCRRIAPGELEDSDSNCENRVPGAELRMNLKNQLARYLEIRDLTAAQLARRSGVSRQTISDWLTGRSPRNIEQVKKVADVLGLTVDQLCFGPNGKGSTAPDNEMEQFGDEWFGGLFEIRLRRVKSNK